jgi:hypothetical protein
MLACTFLAAPRNRAGWRVRRPYCCLSNLQLIRRFRPLNPAQPDRPLWTGQGRMLTSRKGQGTPRRHSRDSITASACVNCCSPPHLHDGRAPLGYPAFQQLRRMNNCELHAAGNTWPHWVSGSALHIGILGLGLNCGLCPFQPESSPRRGGEARMRRLWQICYSRSPKERPVVTPHAQENHGQSTLNILPSDGELFIHAAGVGYANIRGVAKL